MQQLIHAVRAFVESHAAELESIPVGEVGDLLVQRRPSPTALEDGLYRPSLCIVLQGSKQTLQAGRSLLLEPGHFVVVSHHIPIVSRVVTASPGSPYLALVMAIDLSIVRSLAQEIGEPDLDAAGAHSLEVGRTDEDLLDAARRLLEFAHQPLEAKVLAPGVRREIHLRLLLTRQGALLRQLTRRRSHAHRIGNAIADIRQEIARPLSVEELARVAGMSRSSFHQHFKMITGTTPLQYQKEIRLFEARLRILDGTHSVAEAAYDVGYESPTQFSREYSRKFGHPPREDLAGASG